MKRFIFISSLLMMLFSVFASSAYCQNCTITQLTDNDVIDGSPHINTVGQVAWSGFDGHDFEIFLYDGLQTIQITNNDDEDLHPVINDNGQVVWEHSLYGLYRYDDNGINQFSNNYKDTEPDINSRDQVVWEADLGDKEILFFDGSKVIQLTDNEHNDRKPHINDNGQVVWEADIGDIEIFLANPN